MLTTCPVAPQARESRCFSRALRPYPDWDREGAPEKIAESRVPLVYLETAYWPFSAFRECFKICNSRRINAGL